MDSNFLYFYCEKTFEGGRELKSKIYGVSRIPIPDFSESNHHPGIEELLKLLGDHDYKFYKSLKEGKLSGPDGLISNDDLVLLKVNAQWKHRGMTNIDVMRGLIQRILDHPEGFGGEVVLFENGQGRGSLDCDMCDAWYATDESAANAEDATHTWRWLIHECYRSEPVSMVLFDEHHKTEVAEDDHEKQGYRFFNPHPERHPWALTYPVFNTQMGSRVDFRRGIWTENGYDNDKVKLLSIPVMKNHLSAGVTGALKLYFGVLSIHWNNAEYHDNIGLTCAEMFSHIRSPDLNIMDLTWLPVNAVNGHPDTLPQRTNRLFASTDPLALDYWVSKHVLFPLSINPLHNPEEPLKFRMKTLLPAKEEFDKCGGIRGNRVNMKDEDIIVCERAM